MKSFFTGILYFFLFSFLACGGPPISSTIKKADSLIKEERLSEALILYQKAIQEHPKEIVLYLNQAALFRQTKDYLKARQNYKIVRRINPYLPHSSFGMARVAFDEQNFHEAIEIFKEVISSQENPNPEEPEVKKFIKKRDSLYQGALLYLARSYMALEQSAEALKAFDKIVQETTPRVDVYYYRGKLYENFFKDEKMAFADYQTYVDKKGPLTAELQKHMEMVKSKYKF